MSTGQLRWILLLAGIVFMAVLAVVETRRARRAAAGDERRRRDRLLPDAGAAQMQPLGHEEPARYDESGRHDEPALGELPLEFPAASVQAERGLREPLVIAEMTVMAGIATEAVVPPAAAPLPVEVTVAGDCESAPDAIAPVTEAATPARAPKPLPAPAAAMAAPASAATIRAPPPPPPPLRVEWPPEGERQIVAVRIVPSRERLSGRATRQGLAACGFVHGAYQIFHQPLEDGRALLSCANLSRPGSFDPTGMDLQHYAGICLFTVLPGPLPGPLALERLLETARELSHRLQGQLQDESGLPLDATRLAALRARIRVGTGEAQGTAPAA